MKVSLHIIKSLTSIRGTVDELVARINQQLGGVEEVTELGAAYAGATIVRVVSATKHPNADKLTICMVDDGGVTPRVERDDNGLVQVVCGAPNVVQNMMAVWLPPQSTVPSTWNDDEPFVLDARELRGVMSSGMLAAADELGIGVDHSGIIALTSDDLPPELHDQSLEPGQKFAEVFGLEDAIIDIENKMFTHRPDCFGQIGVAREIAGIQHEQFASPDWYIMQPEFEVVQSLPLAVVNEAGDNVPRFMAVAMQNIVVKPSPMWLQCALVAMGCKPINNVVDVTNYLMLMTGQPLHAYDYDKLDGQQLGVRMAREGETLPLLNGKTYDLTHGDIVIIDGAGPVGMGGIMGGGSSEVSPGTTAIVLEAACFDMYTIRKTSMRHGLFTDAVTRFTKGQSPLQQDRILGRAMQLLAQLAGAEQASVVHDKQADLRAHSQPIAISAQFVNERLGLGLDVAQMSKLLANVEIGVEAQLEDLVVTPPFWRTDLELPEDLVEEIGRLYGFDALPQELPTRSIAPAAVNPYTAYTQKIRDSLRRMGANEVLTYSFVHQHTMQKAEQDVSQAFQLSNALSPDLQYYRLSVLPSLLERVKMNIRAGYDEFALYEIGKGHNKRYHREDDDGLPRELEFVDMVYTSRLPRDGAAFYRMRRMVTRLALDLGFELHFSPIDEPLDYPVTAPFDQSRSALVTAMDGTFIGMIGELKGSVRKQYKLPEYVAAATLDLDGLIKVGAREQINYAPLSKFPAISRDVSLRTAVNVSYSAVADALQQAIKQHDDLQVRAELTSIYLPDEQAEHKTYTFHLDIVSSERTLRDEDVTPLMDDIAARTERAVGATIV